MYAYIVNTNFFVLITTRVHVYVTRSTRDVYLEQYLNAIRSLLTNPNARSLEKYNLTKRKVQRARITKERTMRGRRVQLYHNVKFLFIGEWPRNLHTLAGHSPACLFRIWINERPILLTSSTSNAKFASNANRCSGIEPSARRCIHRPILSCVLMYRGVNLKDRHRHLFRTKRI